MDLATFDTGMCVPERMETLELQQRQLIAGARNVQMFPVGTEELSIPEGMARHQNSRGVFHFRPHSISRESIEAASSEGRENEFLNLGPYSKGEIARRVLQGEPMLCVAEYAGWIEVRSAVGTESTRDDQLRYFDATKQADSHVVVCDLAHVIVNRLRGH